MIKQIQAPAPLSTHVLHTPAEVRKWKQDNQDYLNAKNAQAAKEAAKAEAKHAAANKVLSEEEYHALAVEREAAKQADQEAYAARIKEKEAAAAAFLLTTPPVVSLNESNPANFLSALTIWIRKGYDIDLNGELNMGPFFYLCTLVAPAAPVKKAGK